jgi:benzoyl-CoA 2,3-dioxygenase component B
MLTEEAHHLFVGETGVGRTVEATCKAMVKAGISDPFDTAAIRALGVIDLPTLQKKANFHMSVTRDLFGSEISSNGATAFSAGLKGRFEETRINDDHQLANDTYAVQRIRDGQFVTDEVPALTAINSRLLDDYIKDCQGDIDRWNKTIRDHGINFQIKQPHKAFNRRIGEFAGTRVSPDGEILSEAQWQAGQDQWLCGDADHAYIQSLMQPSHQTGQYASWIAPPRVGINNQPGDFEYVKLYSDL